MRHYQTVLIAIDVYANFTPVIDRGVQIAGSPQACHVLYVACPQSSCEPYGLFLERDYSEEVRRQASQALSLAGEKYAIPDTQLHVTFGSPASEIQYQAEKLGADLIVMGTRGQSGMQLLLGSTANAVLHGVKTDVLAVKLTM
ncbi:universal stress protein [Alteromonas halophila]|nr:universal stress protein [Alteromonas halophila]